MVVEKLPKTTKHSRKEFSTRSFWPRETFFHATYRTSVFVRRNKLPASLRIVLQIRRFVIASENTNYDYANSISPTNNYKSRYALDIYSDLSE